MLKRQLYDYKTDVWSMGIVLYQLSALKLPFEPPESKYDVEALNFRIIHKEPKQLPATYSKSLVTFIQSCLIKYKEKRHVFDP